MNYRAMILLFTNVGVLIALVFFVVFNLSFLIQDLGCFAIFLVLIIFNLFSAFYAVKADSK